MSVVIRQPRGNGKADKIPTGKSRKNTGKAEKFRILREFFYNARIFLYLFLDL